MLIQILIQLIGIIQILLIVYFILSWFPLNPSGIPAQIQAMLDRFFYPVLAFLRRYIPPAGPFDLAGLVLVFGLYFLRAFLITLV